MKPSSTSRARELACGLTELIHRIEEDKSQGIKTGIYHSPTRSYYFNNIKEIKELKAKILKQALKSKGK